MAGQSYSGSQAAAGQGGGQAGGQPGASQISSDPRTALGQIDQYLTQHGYQRQGAATHNASFQQGALIAYQIQARAELCYTVVALAQPNTDLNMFIIDPAGRTIGYNVEPDAHPWTTVCPGVTGQVFARLQMVRGTGDYFYAVYQGSPSARPNLATLFGAVQVQAQQAQLDAGATQRLTALDQRLTGERFQRLGEPRGEVFDRGQDRNYQLNLQQGTCYAFATLGGEGAQDTDVFLQDGSGNELARDVSAQRDALVQYCPETTGAYTLRARMYSGQGPLFTAVYSRGTQQQQQQEVIAETSTQGAGLDENFRLLDSDMRARGYEAHGEPSRGQLAQGQERDFSISLEGGKCYAILAVGDSGVRDLDLVLHNASGEQIDRDVETDPRPVVRVCAGSTGSYTMKVKMFSGQGNFVYAAYRWPRGTRGPFGLSGLIYVRLGEVTSLLAVEGYEPDVDATPGQGTLRREGQSRSHNIQLTQGQCYSVLAVGGEGVANLDVTLAQGSTQLASDGTRTAFPSVRHCAERTGRYSLTVRTGSGSGQYFYQVFRRSGS